MAKPLTARTLETMKPGPVRREVPDGLVHGLYFVMQPSGASSWAVRYRRSGASRKLTLGSWPAIDLKHARELASAALVAVARGDDPAASKKEAKRAEAVALAGPAHDSVEAVVAAFVERHCRPKLRTAEDVNRVLKREVVLRWKGRGLSEITRADVHALLDGLIDRGAPIQANRVFAYLSKLFRWAMSRGLVTQNPCDGLGRPSAEKSRDRVLDDRELALIWNAAESLGWPFAPIMRLLILTGARKSEIAEGRWAEIDHDVKVWSLAPERVKNKRAHSIPLSPQAVAILESLPRIAGDFVFSTNGKTAVSGFSRAKHNLDVGITALNNGEPIPNWTIHDLRRSTASGLARIGVDLVVIERCLNHISGSFAGIVQVYQRHKFEMEIRAALEAWGRYVEAIVSGNAAARAIASSEGR